MLLNYWFFFKCKLAATEPTARVLNADDPVLTAIVYLRSADRNYRELIWTIWQVSKFKMAAIRNRESSRIVVLRRNAECSQRWLQRKTLILKNQYDVRRSFHRNFIYSSMVRPPVVTYATGETPHSPWNVFLIFSMRTGYSCQTCIHPKSAIQHVYLMKCREIQVTPLYWYAVTGNCSLWRWKQFGKLNI